RRNIERHRGGPANQDAEVLAVGRPQRIDDALLRVDTRRFAALEALQPNRFCPVARGEECDPLLIGRDLRIALGAWPGHKWSHDGNGARYAATDHPGEQ